jgi:transposase
MPRRRRYRCWNAEEKRSICQQTRAPGVSVAQVARRHALNANLIFKWLKDPRFAPVAAAEEEPAFLPVEVRGICQLSRQNEPTLLDIVAVSAIEIHHIVARAAFGARADRSGP